MARPKTIKKPVASKKDRAVSQNSQALAVALSLKQDKRKKREKKKEIDQLFKDLAPADFEHGIAEKLADVENNEAIEEWLQEYGEDDADLLRAFEDTLGTVAKILRARRSNATSGNTPEVLKSFSKYFLYRDGSKNFTILAPVDVFNTSAYIGKKTMAFVREKGDDWPLKYAISGVHSSIKHPKVLDNDIWTQLAQDYGQPKGFFSRSSGYELSPRRQAEKGIDFSSHVERKLMLFFCTEKYRQYVQKDESPEYCLARLHELNRYYGPTAREPRITAEIVLNRKPCTDCEKFRILVEDVTGFRFEWVIIDTLGKCQLVQNEYKHKSFAPASEEVLEFSDHEIEDEFPTPTMSSRSKVTQKTALQVVIPRAKKQVIDLTEAEEEASPRKTLVKRRKEKISRQSSIVEETTITALGKVSRRVSEERISSRISDFTYVNPKAAPQYISKAHQGFAEQDNEADETYVDPKSKAAAKRSLPLTSPGSQKSPAVSKNVSSFFRGRGQAHGGGPFSAEAVAEAERVRQNKRKRAPSPPAFKRRARHD